MTLKNLLSVAAATALMISPALAQPGVTDNPAGPVLYIDLIRDGGAPVLGDSGGLLYGVFVSPDASQPTFDTASGAAGPLGAGGSIAAEFGILINSGGLEAQADGVTPDPLANQFGQDITAVEVTVNGTPGDGTTTTEPGESIVDFALPGNGVFGFEVDIITSEGADAPDTVGGVQSNLTDSIFASLGSTFIAAGDVGSGTGPNGSFELLRFETAPLSASNLDFDIDLIGPEVTSGSILVAQSEDLSVDDNPDGNPIATLFSIGTANITDTIFEGDSDLDGDVDGDDFNTVLLNFDPGGLNANNFATADFDGDGDVDGDDFNSILLNFNPGGLGGVAPVLAATAVPEPSTAALFAFCLLTGAAARRSKN